MKPDISEHSFEEAIEQALLAHGLDANPGNSAFIREAEEIVHYEVYDTAKFCDERA